METFNDTEFNETIRFNNDMLEIVDSARERYIPVMLNKTAKFLFDLIKQYKPKNVLEIGTAIGYSGLVMLKAGNHLSLTTIEVDKERSEEALKNFKKFNYETRINLINEDGLSALTRLSLNKEKFDFVFLDGPKGQYLKYFEKIEKLITKNAIVVVDDVLFNYNICGENEVNHKHRAMITKLREFVKKMIDNEKYNVNIFNIDEGVMLIKEKNCDRS